MVASRDAYVDTSALIAFLDRSDSYHHVFAHAFSNPPRLVSTSLVIAEGHAWFLKRFDSSRGIQFLNFVADLKGLSITPVGSHEIYEGTKLLRKYRDQVLTLTDTVGLYIMKEKRLNVCWSTDRHLGLSGVPLLMDHPTHQR